MTLVKWLHLSDWHQGAPDLDRKVVRDALIEDIERRAQISGDLASLDFIFFTGDLAWSGLASEYAAAERDFLNEVLRVTGVGKDRLFVIPGNHDFDRRRLERFGGILGKVPENRADLKKLFEDETYRDDLLTAFRGYDDWLKAYQPAGFGPFGGTCTVPVGDRTVGIVAANSAMLCGRNVNRGKKDDYGRLAIGEVQVYDNLRSIADSDLRIGLVHHPFEWLLELDKEDTEGRLLAGCDFILRGHEHTGRVHATHSTDGDCRLIRGGAAYNGRIPERGRYANSYNFVSYDIETKTGTVYFRVLDDATSRWIPDGSKGPDGTFSFNSPTASLPPARSGADGAGLSGSAGAGDAGVKTPNNLPVALTRFVGREAEIAQVREFLGAVRLVTLTGTGGTGKTRLALKTAERVLDEYPDGVWLVELASLLDAGLVWQTVGAVLGVREEAGVGIEQALVAHLKDKRLLLVLDNCEHLVDACSGLVVRVLRECAGVRVLATSREVLGIGAEQVYLVPPLTVPKAGEVTAAEVAQSEAGELFVDKAQRVRPDFAVTDGNAPALGELCRKLDGIPLAIELAAARVRSLTVEEINARLGERFHLLTGGDRSAPKRHQTLRATIDWSYDLLSESEKVLFARLSIFAGGWMLDAAESVCGFDPLEESDVLDLLTSLVDKSLVLAEEQGGTTRYRMLETLREYASERLRSSNETMVLQSRHCDWYVSLAQEANLQSRGAEGLAWLKRLEVEHDNLRDAIDTCIANNNTEFGLSLVSNIAHFWDVRGYLKEGREQIVRVLDIIPEEHCTLQLSIAMTHAGHLAEGQGDVTAAQKMYGSALSLAEKMNDKEAIGGALNHLGNIAYSEGDTTLALRLYEEGLTTAREIGNKGNIATALRNVGMALVEQGNFDKARQLLEESLAINQEAEDLYGVAESIFTLGTLYDAQDDLDTAWSLYHQAFMISDKINDKQRMAEALSGLGSVAWQQTDYPVALTMLRASIVIRRDLGDKRNTASLLEHLGLLMQSVADTQWEDKARDTEHDTAINCMLLTLQSVMIWGAAEVLRSSIDFPRTPDAQSHTDMFLNRLRTMLGEVAYNSAWEEGKNMSWEETVDFALRGSKQAEKVAYTR